jgi:hypothetical protein
MVQSAPSTEHRSHHPTGPGLSNAEAGAIARALEALKSKPLLTWGALVLLPSLLLLVLRSDLLLAPRTVLAGTVNGKMLRVDSQRYATMRFRLGGQPYGFSGLIEMVQGPTPHPKSSYAAVREGVPAKVTVLERDLEGAGGAPPDAVPVLLIEQDGSYVFISGEQLQAWIMVPGALALTLLGLLGIVGGPRRLGAWLPAPLRAVLSGFDRGAQGFAQLLHPTRELDPLERRVQHGTYVAMARLWLVVVMVMVPALLVALVLMEWQR